MYTDDKYWSNLNYYEKDGYSGYSSGKLRYSDHDIQAYDVNVNFRGKTEKKLALAISSIKLKIIILSPMTQKNMALLKQAAKSDEPCPEMKRMFLEILGKAILDFDDAMATIRKAWTAEGFENGVLEARNKMADAIGLTNIGRIKADDLVCEYDRAEG